MGWPGQLLPALRPARTYTIQRSGGAVSFPPPPLRRGPEADHGPRHPVEDGAEGPHGDQVEQGRLGSAALRPEREQHVDPAAEAVGGGPGGEWEHIGAGALGDEPGGRRDPEAGRRRTDGNRSHSSGAARGGASSSRRRSGRRPEDRSKGSSVRTKLSRKDRRSCIWVWYWNSALRLASSSASPRGKRSHREEPTHRSEGGESGRSGAYVRGDGHGP